MESRFRTDFASSSLAMVPGTVLAREAAEEVRLELAAGVRMLEAAEAEKPAELAAGQRVLEPPEPAPLDGERLAEAAAFATAFHAARATT